MISEALLRRWLHYWHGCGTEGQWDYYRCRGCRRLVSWNAIKKGGCDCGLSNELVPTGPPTLGRWRVLGLILFPWVRVVR